MTHLLARRATSFVIVFAGLMVCAACDSEDGRPIAGDNIGPASSQASSPPPSADSTGSSLEQIVACDLLSPDEREQVAKNLKITPKGPFGGSSDTCEFELPDSGDVFSFLLAVRPNETVENYVPLPEDEVADGDVDGRTAKQVAGKDSCVVTFAAAQGRIDINVAAKNTKAACSLADEVSAIVAPKAPKPNPS